MKLNKLLINTISLFLSSALLISPVSYAETAVSDKSASELAKSMTELEEICTISFVDFYGNVMNTQKLKKGAAIDYSLPDTDSLKSNINPFTQRIFSEWDIHPETATSDMTINALYSEAVIALESVPSKTVYDMDDTGKIDVKGLKVTITISTQTTDFDEQGNRIINTEVTDISSSCTLSPENIEDAFEKSDTAEIKIYPISSSVPVGSYNIKLDFIRGDVNFDGIVDASDATDVIRHYGAFSMGVNDGFTPKQKRVSDVNRDGVIDAADASDILIYYSKCAAGEEASWD
ncbi:MAG: hypothetical protein K2G63_03090 [Oscillospiraceae bacterium]|nr:hypothetical protein [Oscillospiraceae bacterium]